MFDSRTSRLARNAGRTQVIGMKTVVGHENDSGIRPGELQKSAEHHVVVAVSAFEAIVENAEVPVLDVGLFGRMIPHESVAEMVDRVEVNSHEVPRFAF